MEAHVDGHLVALLKHMPAGLFEGWMNDHGETLAAYIAERLDAPLADVRTRVAAVRANRAALARCLALPKIEQRTPDWYAARENILTASDLGQALGKSKYGSRTALLLQKTKFVERTFDAFARRAMDNGVMFEPMALRAYQESRGDVPVYDFGLLRHPTLTCFGASPDGITALGTCIEIKCPLSRKLTGVVPDHYYYQMQGQMAVCGVTETDYIEAKFERYSVEDYVAAAGGETTAHGVTIRLVKNNKDAEARADVEAFYIHSPPRMLARAAVDWANREAWAHLEADPLLDVGAIVYWRIVRLDVIRVAFDADAWAATIAPGIQAFHDERQRMAARLTGGETPYEGYAEKKKRERKPPPSPPADDVDFVDDEADDATGAC